jgi:hypothetical protein
MVYNFNFKTFNFNLEVGGKKIISKLVTLRTLVDFFRNRHHRPLELAFGRFIQRNNRNFKKLAVKMS